VSSSFVKPVDPGGNLIFFNLTQSKGSVAGGVLLETVYSLLDPGFDPGPEKIFKIIGVKLCPGFTKGIFHVFIKIKGIAAGIFDENRGVRPQIKQVSEIQTAVDSAGFP
jgi:hypothetical protein